VSAELETFAALAAANAHAKEEATDAPYTEAEMAEIRARARGEVAEELLCVDYWTDELKPKHHQPRPGALSLKGSPRNAGCLFVLADPFAFTDKRNKDGFAKWSQMHLTHKEQCAACRAGTSIL
jgi:hypothetical protein